MRKATLGLLLLLTACTPVEEVALTDWSHHADFPGVARASAATFVIGDTAYVCCGRTDSLDATISEVWKFNSLNDSWTQLEDFPGDPRLKPIGLSINGKGYVGMGSRGSHYENSVFNDFYEFDPTTGQWTQRASFPGLGGNDLAYAVINGCLYTTMGFTGYSRSVETYKYDPATDAWTKLEACPSGYSAPAFFAIGDAFYVAGGYQGRNIRTMFRFDAVGQKWSSVASMPKGRIMSNGLTVSGKGYVLLGRFWAGSENGGGLLSDVLEYDSNENSWTKRGEFPGGKRQAAMVFTIRDRGYVLMGENDFQLFSDVWSFKP